MRIPGFMAEESFISAQTSHSSAHLPNASAQVRPAQHEHRPLKEPLLTSHGPAHSCSTITQCAQMIWSGVCQGEGLPTVCTDTGCAC